MINRIKSALTKRSFNLKRYYKPLKYPTISLNSDDLYITTTIGDRLDLLAYQFYKDTRLWWVIMNANVGIIRRDSFSLKPNLQIRIPKDIDKIVGDFEDLNQK
jgi:nucleoid-associated protein YgaU